MRLILNTVHFFWAGKKFALIKLNKLYERQEFDLKFLSNAAVERYTWVCGLELC